MVSALLVIDMQVSLIADETPNADEIVAAVETLVELARGVGDPVIWVRDSRVEPDARLVADFAPAEGELEIVKAHANAFEDTDLDAELTILGVERLVICGMQSDACIDGTVRGGADLGYNVVLVADAHTTHDWQGRGYRDVIVAQNEVLAAIDRVAVLPAGEVVF